MDESISLFKRWENRQKMMNESSFLFFLFLNLLSSEMELDELSN